MARPNLSGKQPVATVDNILNAIINGTVKELMKEKKLTFGVIAKAEATLKGFKQKLPGELASLMAELQAEGRSGGIRGKVPPKIGEEKDYAIQNTTKDGKEKSAVLVVPLSMYDKAKKAGARANVKFEKNSVTITF